MTDNTYPFEATSDIPGIAFSAMRQIIMTQARSAGLKVLEDADMRLTVETAHGLIGLRPGAEAKTAGFVGATDEHWLFVMKTAVTRQMEQMMPEVAKQMRWSNGPKAGALPPNFRFAQVRKVIALGPNFLRVDLQGDDLSMHRDAAIHFRLVLPPVGHPPAWPRVAENGSIVWPDGPGAPHRPVYTTRYMDHDTHVLSTDVYVHDGGRTTEWARGNMAAPGARQVVGILGPSGGGLLEADHVLMATDETGFPAAARLLEHLPATATGTLLLEAENGAACAYPIAAPPGIEVTWLSRSKGDVLGEETHAAMPDHAGANLWFAGEKGQAKTLREAAKAAGWPSERLRISGFWSR